MIKLIEVLEATLLKHRWDAPKFLVRQHYCLGGGRNMDYSYFFFLFYLFARTSLPATRNEFDHTVRHGESRSCSLESFACRSMGPQLMKKDQVGRFSLVLKVRLLLSGLVLPGAREL